MTAMILPKLGMCKNADEAATALVALGGECVGSGHFAKVYSVAASNEIEPLFPSYKSYMEFDKCAFRPVVRYEALGREERIIKVVRCRGKRTDRAGLMTAKAAMATSALDPLAPVYYGLIEFADGSWIAEMEPLEPVTMEAHSALTGSEYSFRPTSEVVAASPYLKLIEAYIERNSITPVAWDMHEGNVMLRNGRPVVTDPIYSAADV